MKCPYFGLVELTSKPSRVDSRPPESLVCIDVPHAGERSLVEEDSLHRSTAPGESFGEIACRKDGLERLRDVEWARRLGVPFPLGWVETTPHFAVVADA